MFAANIALDHFCKRKLEVIHQALVALGTEKLVVGRVLLIQLFVCSLPGRIECVSRTHFEPRFMIGVQV